MNGTEKLKELAPDIEILEPIYCDNEIDTAMSQIILYFLAGPVSRQKAGFLIFEVRTDFITRSMIIRRKPF